MLSSSKAESPASTYSTANEHCSRRQMKECQITPEHLDTLPPSLRPSRDCILLNTLLTHACQDDSPVSTLITSSSRMRCPTSAGLLAEMRSFSVSTRPMGLQGRVEKKGPGQHTSGGDSWGEEVAGRRLA